MKVKLNETGKIITGNTPKTSEIENYSSNDIPFIKPSDILEDDIVSIRESEFWISDHARKKARILPPNSVLVTCIGIIGKVAINTCECAFNQQINAIIPDSERYLPEYLAYAILAKQKYLQDIANAPVVPIINKSQFADIDIQTNDIQTQKRVVDKLSLVSELIKFNNYRLNKFDELVKSRFVEMFGHPVSNSKHWKTEFMNDVAPSNHYDGIIDEDVWLLNLDMIESQTGRIIEYRYVKKKDINNSTCSFDTSNVLYSKLRPYLNKVVIPDRAGYATSELIPLQPDKTKLNRDYFAFMLRSDEFVSLINEKVAGAKMPRVSMTDFKKFSVPIPPIELQNQFADFVTKVEQQKSTVQNSIEKLETLKKSLMQEYFG